MQLSVRATPTAGAGDRSNGANGLLVDVQDAWVVGERDDVSGDGFCGMHYCSLSPSQPGCVWISTETDDRIYLVDPSHGFRVLYEMHVPTALPAEADGTVHHVGGPHSVREAP